MITLNYDFWGPYNNPRTNERNIELPIAFWFIENYDDNLVEIGEVTPFYREAKHPIYDLSSDIADRRRDVFDLNLTDKNVLSISTVEHVGFGDYGNTPEPHKAIKAIEHIISQARNFMITYPVGYNTELDKDLMESGIHYFVMYRDENNKWFMSVHNDLTKFMYNDPFYAGNAIVVITDATDGILIKDK